MKKYTLTLIVLAIAFVHASAVNHIVTFGPSLSYSPDSFTVEVGDTITWQGQFSSHPLESTSVPSGASPFGRGGNVTTFSYVVTVAGNYTYRCAIHGGSGMTGQFTAVATSTGAGISPHAAVRVFPVVTSDAITVEVNNFDSQLNLDVINSNGQTIQSILSLTDSRTTLNLRSLSKGLYFITIRSNEEIVSVTKVVKQ